jgi:hypothetical protein
MGKRGNGEGSISRRKNGGWTAQYVVYTAEGRKKRKTLYSKTRQEVAAKLAKALSDREDGLVFDWNYPEATDNFRLRHCNLLHCSLLVVSWTQVA